jgi:hypothetical protein
MYASSRVNSSSENYISAKLPDDYLENLTADQHDVILL